MSGSPRKATVFAPANIAFVKYWGATDLEAVHPVNRSISMTLTAARTQTTVEPKPDGAHELLLVDVDGGLAPAEGVFARRAIAHVERVCREIGYPGVLRVATRNHFPTGAGIASSASGFTALTLAVRAACGAPEAARAELSRQIRRSGSGSAARSVYGGYVEWPSEEADDDPAAAPIASADHWELLDLVAIVASGPKGVTSRDGHRLAPTSPHFARRLAIVPDRLAAVREAIAERSLDRLGPVVEEEAIELHLIAMSSRPPIYYWEPGTLEVLAAARSLRERGVPVWATIDAGPNVHLICEPAAEAEVCTAIERLGGVERVLRDRVGEGPFESEEHLF